MHGSVGRFLVWAFLFGFVAMSIGCESPQQEQQKQSQSDATNSKSKETAGQGSADPKNQTEVAAEDNSVSMFDGKTIDGWETIEFGGEGDVEVVDGEIRMYDGDPLSGICVIEGTELPTANYEFSLEAMKLEGHDFFCAVTFPVNDTFCTMVVGGWGGNLVGLSNLDGQDASSNQTKLMRKFEKDQWYAIRIQVLPDRITAWIDDEKLIDESIEGVEVSIRGDVSITTPLGITNFETSSSFRNIKMRKLD